MFRIVGRMGSELALVGNCGRIFYAYAAPCRGIVQKPAENRRAFAQAERRRC